MLNEAMLQWGREKSAIRETFSYGLARAACIGADKVFDFSLGNPSVPAPPSVQQAIASALELPPAELHGYSPATGLPYVRERIAQSLNRRFAPAARRYTADDLYLTVGAAASLCATLSALTRPGDEVIVIAPYFPEYRVWIERAGCRCVEVLADQETFQLDVQAIAAAVTDRTAAVIINSPNNPTGAIYGQRSLEQLSLALDAASRRVGHTIYLISDEPYRELTYGAQVPWVPDYYGPTVVCYSYSKSLSLPGERIGWILVPPAMPQHDDVFAAICGAARALGYVCAPVLFQRVIAACVDEPADVAAYARNRTLLTEALSSCGYAFVQPQGAFYLWVRALEEDAEAFCARARTYELLVVPSNSFGVPGWFRVGYCVDHRMIERSLPAWKQLADEYR